ARSPESPNHRPIAQPSPASPNRPTIARIARIAQRPERSAARLWIAHQRLAADRFSISPQTRRDVVAAFARTRGEPKLPARSGDRGSGVFRPVRQNARTRAQMVP